MDIEELRWSRILSLPLITALSVPLSASNSGDAAEEKGYWLQERKDAANTALADVAGSISEAPREVWSMPIESGVSYARPVRLNGEDALLTLVGSNLAVYTWEGKEIWSRARLGITQVFKVADFDKREGMEIFVKTDPRTVMLLDADNGETLWSWQCETSANISGYQFQETETGIRHYTFPAYSLVGVCFDFSDDASNPEVVWKNTYKNEYLAGFGPSPVLGDFTGDGKDDLAIHGKDPMAYQAILDTDTGEILYKTSFTVDPEGPIQVGRPYGLFNAADFNDDGRDDLLMISCQVEEYLAVTRNSGEALERVWGRFIEKDWPYDHVEIRPQIRSVADIDGDGVVDLVVGHYDGKQWHTKVLDPFGSFEEPIKDLSGLYFWGCYDLDGDGVAEIVTSEEGKRLTASRTTLHAIDGRSYETVASLDKAVIFASGDSDHGNDRFFMAGRQNPVYVERADGMAGVLVRVTDSGCYNGIYIWGGKEDGHIRAQAFADLKFSKIHSHDGMLLLSDEAGNVQRFSKDLVAEGDVVRVHGGMSKALVAPGTRGGRELLLNMAGSLVGGKPDFENGGLKNDWRVSGAYAAVHVDADGTRRVLVADTSNDNPGVLIYKDKITKASLPQRIETSHPPYIAMVPYGDEFRVLVNLQTGVHTMALMAFDAEGNQLWRDPDLGAHPRRPAMAHFGEPGWLAVADDHGKFTLYNEAGERVALNHEWAETPNYSLPICGAFMPGGGVGILRPSGITAIGMWSPEAKPVWQFATPSVWTYYKSISCLGRTQKDGGLMMLTMTETGTFECYDAETGENRWAVDLDVSASGESIIGADVDGDGEDEFLIGLSDGRLVCIGERDGEGCIEWTKQFDAMVANPIFADVDGDGEGEIVVSTSDGYVRVLR